MFILLIQFKNFHNLVYSYVNIFCNRVFSYLLYDFPSCIIILKRYSRYIFYYQYYLLFYKYTLPYIYAFSYNIKNKNLMKKIIKIK